jgi:single-strand DNA-binding protein
VYVEGRLQTRSYDDKDGNKRYMTEVVAEEVILLGGRGEAPSGDSPYEERSHAPAPRASRPPASSQEPPQAQSPFDSGITDDDVPF